MVGEEDLQRIRENRPSLRPDSEIKNRTSKKKFLKHFSVSCFAAVVLVYLTVTYVGAGVTVTGAGGFYVEFEQVNGQGAYIYPAVTQSSQCQSTVMTNDNRPKTGDTALPVLRVDIRGATIPPGNSVKFIKTINVPDLLTVNTFSIVVEQGNHPTDSTVLRNTTIMLTRLTGDSLSLGETLINESYTQPAGQNPPPQNETFGPGTLSYYGPKSMDVLGEFVVKGSTASVSNGQGIAHFIFFERLVLPEPRISIAYDKYDQYSADGSCPV